MANNGKAKLSDLTPDDRNANKGTQRGTGVIEDSLRKYGAGRSILVDRNGKIIAGNKTAEAAASIGLENVRIIETDGHEIVAVKRTDLDLDSKEARELAIADNRAGELNLDWDVDALTALEAEGVDLDGLFYEDELQALLGRVTGEAENAVTAEQGRQTLAERFLVPPFSVLDARQGYWQERKRAWLALGIQSELGRGVNLQGMSDSNHEYCYNKQAYLARRVSPGGAPRPAARLVNGHTIRGDGKGNGLLGFSEQARTHYKGNTLGAIPPNERDILSRSGKYNARPPHGPSVTQNPDGTLAYRPTNNGEGTSGTSIFDPVLCELAYRWFCPPGGHVLDPFAGGSVRGIVAVQLGREYTGIDLRPEQVAANEVQAASICPQASPRWLVGDSRYLSDIAPADYDFLFSCPPYFDLEQYSDDPADLSNTGDYGAFAEAYRAIIAQAVSLLKPDRFACFTVGDVRDKAGIYRNFVSDTIAAFQDAGAKLYNEAILVTACGSLPIRAAKQFSSGRKLGKTHQNVLVFVKGDPAKATKACGPVEVGELPEPADAMGLTPEQV